MLAQSLGSYDRVATDTPGNELVKLDEIATPTVESELFRNLKKNQWSEIHKKLKSTK